MKPEQRARKEIDRQLVDCGWHVQDHAAMNLSAGPGIAVREFPLKSGFADYLLYVDGKAVGVIEAKPPGHTLTGVETQSAKYSAGLPASLPNFRLPLPFAYESTGDETQFTNAGQHNISLSLMHGMPIPLPPLAEQIESLVHFEERDSLAESSQIAIESNLDRSARLRQSILKRAFEGKLVPQDANDEPASELLARIQAERTAAEVNGKKKAKRKRKIAKKQ